MKREPTVKDIRKLRQALEIEYRKFVSDFEDIGRRFKKAVIDADLTLEAMEKILDTE